MHISASSMFWVTFLYCKGYMPNRTRIGINQQNEDTSPPSSFIHHHHHITSDRIFGYLKFHLKLDCLILFSLFTVHSGNNAVISGMIPYHTFYAIINHFYGNKLTWLGLIDQTWLTWPDLIALTCQVPICPHSECYSLPECMLTCHALRSTHLAY